MKLAEALRFCLFGILLFRGAWGLPQDQPSSETSAAATLTRCDDIPTDANLDGGMLFIDGHVICPDNNMKWILVTGHSVVRTKDGEGLEMTNVGFVVDPGIQLFFVAPTVVLRKNKNTPRHALIQNEGVVDFWANTWHASFAGGSPVDRYGLVLSVDEGSIVSPERILFSKTAIYAGDPAASSADDNPNILPSQLLSASSSIAEQPRIEDAAPGSSKTGDVTADGDKGTPIAVQLHHTEIDKTGDTGATSTNGASDSLSLPASAATAAAAAGTVVDSRGEQADTDQPRNINTGVEEVGGTAPSDFVSDFDSRIALGFSVADAVDDFAAAISAASDHAAADADDVPSAAGAGGGGGGGGGGGTHSGESEKSTGQLPHPPSASSGPSGSEQASAVAHAKGVLDGVDDLGQPDGTTLDAENMGGTVSSNGVTESAARGASAAAFDPAPTDGDAAADPDATGADASAAVGSTAHKDDDINTAKTLPPQPGFEKAEQATGAVQSIGVSSSGDGTPAPPPGAQLHPGRVVKVGERLRSRLLNSDGTAVTYVSPSDGSIMLVKSTAEDGGCMDEESTGFELEKPTVLVRSNQKKVARVLERRADIFAEEKEEEERVAAGRARKRRGTMGAAVMGWLPFGRKGFLERRKRDHAKAHLGEVEMHLTDRGKVEATIDGTEVLSKAGPSFFGYRRKDPTFEYRTCDDGFEVLRRGKHVWGVTVEND